MSFKEAPVFLDGPGTIKFKGDFSMSELHNTIKKWFDDNRLKFYELLYKDKIDPFNTRVIEIKLYGENKVTEYYKHTVDIRIMANNYEDKFVTIDNKKHKSGQGKVMVQINGHVLVDYKDLFDVQGKPLIVHFYKWLAKLFFSIRKIEFIKKEVAVLNIELENLSKRVRQCFNMESNN